MTVAVQNCIVKINEKDKSMTAGFKYIYIYRTESSKITLMILYQNFQEKQKKVMLELK